VRLVTVAHGTRNPIGNEVARKITEWAGLELGVPATCSFVELACPLFAEVVAASPAPTAVVPLLLSTGHHVRHDLPASVVTAPGPVWLADPLGPHPLLADVQVSRLRAAGAVRGQPVVMVAAGSKEPATWPDLVSAAELLSVAWGGRVELATLSGLGPRPAEVLTPGHAVSPYLLAEGHFAERCRAESAAATCVAEVIGAHPAVVELVVAQVSVAGSCA
jgi:sirohydrochlorin ferrochelatase